LGEKYEKGKRKRWKIARGKKRRKGLRKREMGSKKVK
jgi:hypothetical protein